MNAPESPHAPSENRALLRPFILWTILVALVVLILFTLAANNVLIIPFLLAAGWVSFLTRTLPRISFNGQLFATALFCVVAVLVLAHWFLNWLTVRLGNSRGQAWSWRWRWSWCGASALGVACLVGMSLGGITHQAAWMFSSHEPWFAWNGGRGMIPFRNDARQLQEVLITAVMEAKGDLEQARRQIRNPLTPSIGQRQGQPALFETYACLLIVDDKGDFRGGILFARDPTQWELERRLYYWFDQTEEFFLMTDLPGLIRKHQGNLLAL